MQPEVFSQWCAQRSRANRAQGHRELLVLSGQRDWAESLLEAAICQTDSALLVASLPLAHCQPKVKAASLGVESDWVVIDAHQYQSVNHWLAAAGTLRAGGFLVLLAPALADWPADYARAMRDEGFSVTQSHFVARLARQLPGQPGVQVIEQGCALGAPSPPVAKAHWQPKLPSADQERCINAIRRAAQGRSGRPLVVRADRGRGKTAALGLAAAQLLEEGCRHLVISAARKEMVEIAFWHASQALVGAQRQGNKLCWQGEGATPGYLEYLSPADLLALPSGVGAPDLIMVDEAAHLPLPLLESLLVSFPRLVFSSTVAGYEGTGRGFDLRFRDALDRTRPRWRRESLKAPIRWSASDPLERLLNRVFLLEEAPSSSIPAAENPLNESGQWAVKVVEGGQLASDEHSLAKVFWLLMQAHYQTTPQDLQYLMDLPGIVLLNLQGSDIVGVCQAQLEGGLAESLCEDICAGRRRIKGNLVAQSLAQRSAHRDWLSLSSIRINRIAVAEDRRRQGCASQLLAELGRWGQQRGAAYLSSSFSCEGELLAFWRAQGFCAVNLASRRDSSSGNYSVMVARVLHSVETPLGELREQLRDEQLYCSPLLRPDMPSAALAALLSELPALVKVCDAGARDVQACRRYLGGEIPFESAALHLKRCCVGSQLPIPELVVDRLFKQLPWGQLARRHKLVGRGDCEQQLQAYFRALVSPGDPQR